MTLPLTKLEGVPARQDVIRGMAYFAGTGPASETCKNCKHFGYYRQSRFGKAYHTSACFMFKKLTGKYGPRIDGASSSCKYFDKKAQKKAAPAELPPWDTA